MQLPYNRVVGLVPAKNVIPARKATLARVPQFQKDTYAATRS